jgi:hypothetical protein
MGQKTPSAAAFDDVEDGVHDLAQVMDPRAPGSGLGQGKMSFDVGPLGVGGVGLVCSSHYPASYRVITSEPLFGQFLAAIY